jgi:hypothetical protein
LARHLGVSIDEANAFMADPVKTLSEYPWRPGDHVVQRISSWAEHVRSLACRESGPPVCVIRFEDLVADPEATCTAMARFLNLALPAGRLSLACRSDENVGSAAKGGGIRFSREAWRHAPVLSRGPSRIVAGGTDTRVGVVYRGEPCRCDAEVRLPTPRAHQLDASST